MILEETQAEMPECYEPLVDWYQCVGNHTCDAIGEGACDESMLRMDDVC